MAENKPTYDTDFDNKMLDLAEAAAECSHDTKTQVGAIIYRVPPAPYAYTEGYVVAEGYNSFPPLFNYWPIDMQSDYKHPRIVHAEMRAFFSCTNIDDARGATLYVTHSPCPDCAKHIAFVGIKRVVFRKFKGLGLDLLGEFGIYVDYIPQETQHVSE